MKNKNLLHFKTQPNTAILPSCLNLLNKLSGVLNFSAPHLATLVISTTKQSLKQLARQMILPLSGAFAIALLVTNLFFVSSSFGQEAASANWALSSDGTSSVTGKFTANSMDYGSGITSYLYAFGNVNTKISNQSSLSNAIAGNNYLQFTVSPASGLNFAITSISFGRAVTGGAINISVLFSTDPDFVSYTTVGSTNISNTDIETTSFSVQNPFIAVGNRNTGYIRIYGWNLTESYYFKINNVVISGTTSAACVEPGTQATLQPFTATGNTGTTVNWSRGDGNGVIVVARLTSTVGVDPENFIYYSSANSAFGLGHTTGEGNFIVYIGQGTSVAVTNLIPATNYTFTVYEYNDLNQCYKTPGSGLTYIYESCSAPLITGHPSTATQTLCQAGSATALSVTATGTNLTYQWYSNATASNIGGSAIDGATAASYTPLTTTAGTLYYYCVVSNACPPSAKSNVSGAVTVDPPTMAGLVTGGTSICSGNTSGQLTLGAHTGTVVRWESSVNGTDWTTIVNIADTYTSDALTATTQFRAVVKSGQCDAANSAATTVTIETTPVAGTFGGIRPVAVCEGSSVMVMLTPGSGGNGIDELGFRTKTGETWSEYTAYISGTNISTTGKTAVQIRTRRMAAACSPSGYNYTSWEVEPIPVAGTLVKTPDVIRVCEGTDVYATLIPGSGGNGIDELEYQTKTGAIWSEWAVYISGTPIPTTGKSGVGVRTRHGADVCDPSEYTIVSWFVEATIVPPTLIKYPDYETVCEGTGVSARKISGSGGVNVNSEILFYRTQTVSGWSDWKTYTSDAVILTTGLNGVEIRAKRGGWVCTSDWVVVSWSVVAQPVAGAITKIPDVPLVCGGTDVSATFTAGSGGVGCTDSYSYRYDGTGEWTEYTPASSLSTAGHSLVEIRTQRGGCQERCDTDTRIVSWAIADNQPPTLIPTILPPTTSFTSGGWTSDFSGINVNNTGNTYALVAPGAPVNLKFNWNMYYTGSYCPGCQTQHYVTLQSSGFNVCNQSLLGAGYGNNNGNKDLTFNAPTTPGVYYISLGSSWWHYCNEYGTVFGPNAADNALGYIVVGTNTACPMSIVKNTDPGQCTATISKGIDVVPLDNCGTPSLTYTLTGDTEGSGSGSLSTYTFNKGVTTVSYLVTDISNNSYNCSFTVTVNDNQVPVLPGNGSQTVECLTDATDPEIPIATDNCDGTVSGVLVSITDNLNPLTCQGTRIYRYSFTDAATNVSYWAFTYNIVRTTPPAETDTPAATSATVECIAGAVSPTLPVVKDVCGVTLDAPQPVVTDNYNPLTCGGTREYKYTYTDCAGLKFEWVFTYTIEDKTPPEMACKSKTVMLGLDGNASIVAADVDNGSVDNCGGALNLELNRTSFTCADRPSTMVTLKGTDCAGNTATCNATVNVDLRPTELVYSGDVRVSYSDQVTLKATLKDVTSNTPIAGKTITFTIDSQSATAVTDELGIATTTMVITQIAHRCSVVTSYAEDCPFAAGTDTDEFYINVEKACADYSGVLVASTGSVNSTIANVLLAFTITQENDGFPGDIRNATVQFYEYGSTTGPISPLIPVGLVDPVDKSFGTAVYEWKYDLGTLPSNTVTVFAVVTGGYFRNNPACFGLTPITIYKPGTEFIAGGGYLMLEKPSGSIQADIPSKNNFGFNVKYNKKGTNLQGNINTIVRKTILNTGTGEYELHDYQIKGNVLSSLTVGATVAGVTPAVFTGKANLQDVTDPLNPVSIDGNFVLKVTMTDKGEPGSSDMISITVFDKTGGIWFTSRWENKKPVEQVLAGGNLVVKTGNTKSAEIYTEIAIAPDVEPTLKVFPNPFSERLYFEFVSHVDAEVRIEVYDLTGRLVKTVFENRVVKGVPYNAEFIPNTAVSEMYFYRMFIGKSVLNGKVIYKK